MKADWFSEIKNQEYFETLSHPHFLALDGLVILKAHCTPESFRRWKDRLGLESPAAELPKVENAINHVHLDDLIDKESLQGNR